MKISKLIKIYDLALTEKEVSVYLIDSDRTIKGRVENKGKLLAGKNNTIYIYVKPKFKGSNNIKVSWNNKKERFEYEKSNNSNNLSIRSGFSLRNIPGISNGL